MFFNKLVQMAARETKITCIAQLTFKFVKLLVPNRRFSFSQFEVSSNLLANNQQLTVVDCKMGIVLVFEEFVSFPLVAHHACPRQYVGAYDGRECVFIPLFFPYRNKEAGFGFAVAAAANPLSFDVATAVVLRFVKQAVFTLGLDYDRIIIELNMEWFTSTNYSP